MPEERYDVIVIGAGPGGYVCAIKCAQLGLRTACVEKEPALGGTCLRIGCIPSKALLESSELYHEAASKALERHGIRLGEVSYDLPAMHKRKDDIVSQLTRGVAGLFKKYGVDRLEGTGRIEGPGRVAVGERTWETKNIVIATGSVPTSLRGVDFDGDRIGTSTEALAYPEVPGHLVVIGAGVIGLELGSVWLRLGSKVTVLEYLDRILPGTDGEVSKKTKRIFEKQGMKFHLGARVTGARVEGSRCVVEYEGGEPLECDRVLVATGRRPYLDGLGLDAVGVEVDKAGRVKVDEHFQTSVAGIYAIGDAIPGPMLAHKASEEGLAVAEYLATGYCHVNYDAIPAIVYTSPEIASVGRSEEELQERGVDYRKGDFPFSANGRAKALGSTDGFVKILADKETDRVLGVHIVGPRAGDMIAEIAVAVEFGASAEDLARSSHAHPTLAETIKEAALAVGGSPIHL